MPHNDFKCLIIKIGVAHVKIKQHRSLEGSGIVPNISLGLMFRTDVPNIMTQTQTTVRIRDCDPKHQELFGIVIIVKRWVV